MALRRLFGSNPVTVGSSSIDVSGETETVRRIVRELEQVDPARRRFLAGYAYVLARAAHADLEITEDEARLMEQIVSHVGGLSEAQAILVVEIARHQADLYSGTEDYLVTREFNATATDDERRAAVAACFSVVASDHEITAEEYAELTEIADELGLAKQELNAIRNEYRDQLVAIRRMRSQAGGQSTS
jgi:uncharacterized tellurite resistance protein B-like protein